VRAAQLRALATKANADLYAFLGVQPDATPEVRAFAALPLALFARGCAQRSIAARARVWCMQEIKAAYKREALRWHPDRHPPESRAAAQERFKSLSEAYQARRRPSRGCGAVA
jgi:hypothetical protein